MQKSFLFGWLILPPFYAILVFTQSDKPELERGNSMKKIWVQMIDNSISKKWWNQIISHFIEVGDTFEIRCWKEEIAEITQASLYGVATDDDYEVSVKGVITKKLLEELLTEEPTDKSIYNKMTKYFTVNVKNDLCDISSAHYGTELYIGVVSEKDVEFFEQIISQYPNCFSIGME